MIQVSILIVNYNTVDLTLNCLESIYRWTSGITFEVVLVDNNSHDDSVKKIREKFPEVTIIASKENVGFGKANNLAAANATGEFLFLINTDITFIQNSVKLIYDFYNNNYSSLAIGSLGGLLYDINMNLEGCGSNFPTASSIIRTKFKKLPFFNRFLDDHQVGNLWKTNEVFFEVDYVMGADLFIKKELFDKLNGFDPYFFMYFEETDLAIRLKNCSLRNYIVTDIKLIHSAVLHKDEIVKKPFKNFWLRMTIKTSEVYYVKKNFSKSFPSYVLADIFFCFLSIFKSKFSFKENIQFFIKSLKLYFK